MMQSVSGSWEELMQRCYSVKHADLSIAALVSVVNWVLILALVSGLRVCVYTYLGIRAVCLTTVHKQYCGHLKISNCDTEVECYKASASSVLQ